MPSPVPKGRMIRKTISRSQKIASLSKESMVLFVMLIPHFSSHGKMNGSPHFIKGEVVPLIDWLSIPVIERCLNEISEKTNVKWFKFKGLHYLHSVKWAEHQELRADRLGNDDMPDYSWTTPGLLPPEVEVEDKGKVIMADEIPYQEILTILNTETDSKYRLCDSLRRLIHARWQEGFRIEDFEYVVKVKNQHWKHDKEFSKFIRPETLFGTKFNTYRQQKMEKPCKEKQPDWL